MDIVDAVLNPLKSATETALAAIKLRDTVKLHSALVEIHAKLVAANQLGVTLQETLMELQRENANLREAVQKRENWEIQANRYKLTDFGGGTFAYAYVETDDSAEPPHSICPRCFEQQKRSILQNRHSNHFVCPECSTEFRLGLDELVHGATFRPSGPMGA